jgi:hypothetical protein
MEVMEDVVVILFVLVRVFLFVGIVWLIVREVRKSGRIKK